jgi:hypothetical protein
VAVPVADPPDTSERSSPGLRARIRLLNPVQPVDEGPADVRVLAGREISPELVLVDPALAALARASA